MSEDRGALDFGALWYDGPSGVVALRCLCPESNHAHHLWPARAFGVSEIGTMRGGLHPDADTTTTMDWRGFDASGMEAPEGHEMPRGAVAGRLVVRGGRWWAERTGVGADRRRAGMIPVRPFLSAPAHVRVEYGLTLRTGDFEFARVSVSLSMPCYPAEVDAVAEDASSWVAQRVLAEKAELEAALGIAEEEEGGSRADGIPQDEAPA